MKIKNLFFAICALVTTGAIAQTLYVPSGTAGISSSTTANVGIGISAPTQKLEVAGTVKAGSALLGDSPSGPTYACFRNTNCTTTGNYSLMQNSTGRTFLNAATGQPIDFRINNVTMMTLKSNGYFGIGTANPESNLNIYSTSVPAIKLTYNIGGELGIESNTIKKNGLNLEFWDNSQNLFSIQGQGNECLTNFFIGRFDNSTRYSYYFDINESSSVIEKIMTVRDQELNKDIYALYENGNIIMDGKLTAKEIEVKLDIWADYVFEEDYKLPTLFEVEQYIKENNHLPEVPSATEVMEAGVNLGEMDALLLKKIEELTLYIIEQQKQIDELKTQLESPK